MSDTTGLAPVRTTIRLRSGKYFDLADPKPDQFTLEDIAGALSKICRYGGQIDRFFSVAEHCVRCCGQAALDGHAVHIQRLALMHDSSEAFAGDVVRPLKEMLPEYRKIERRIDDVVAAKYGLGTLADDWAVVKEIDDVMMFAEKRLLFSADDVVWQGEAAAKRKIYLHDASVGWSPTAAERAFLALAANLGIKD